MQDSLMTNSTEASESVTGRRLQRCRDGWPTSRPLAARWGRKAVASTWLLTRNWYHGIYHRQCKSRKLQ